MKLTLLLLMSSLCAIQARIISNSDNDNYDVVEDGEGVDEPQFELSERVKNFLAALRSVPCSHPYTWPRRDLNALKSFFKRIEAYDFTNIRSNLSWLKKRSQRSHKLVHPILSYFDDCLRHLRTDEAREIMVEYARILINSSKNGRNNMKEMDEFKKVYDAMSEDAYEDIHDAFYEVANTEFMTEVKEVGEKIKRGICDEQPSV